MPLIERQLRRIASHGTRVLGMACGERFPFYYVTEYQKSGGTWLAQMLADYLQIPFPQHSVLPMGCACVVQNHWPYTPGLRRVFYLYRDGRDVMVSLYFHRMRRIRAARARGETDPMARTYRRLFGPGYDGDDVGRHLPRFIEHEVRRPRGTRQSWSEHVSAWAFDRPQVVCTSYEALRRSAVEELARILPEHTGRPVDREQLERTVEKFRFERQAGRRPGVEDRGDFKRKGIVGDWRNHFTREAAEVFHRHHGETLVALGYEPDASWVDEVEAPPSRRASG